MAFSRRQFIKAGFTTGLLTPFVHQVMAAPVNAIFDCGIASGDPTHDSVIIWTHTRTPVNLQWQVALDLNFNRVVVQGEGTTEQTKDCTFKVDVTGLNPGTTYYYRFMTTHGHSEPGKTKTLPKGDISQLNIAIASCSNYPFGYFNAYHHIASDELIDVVVHLGDYIYEYGRDGWGDSEGRKINRRHLPEHEIVSLADYRTRHRQYKADNASRLMHASHPLIPTWDDHESANNPYLNGAQNHQANEGDWAARRAASIQAYYEWMPLREPQSGNGAQLWRHFDFGSLASLTTLETRHTGREKQVSYSEHLAHLTSEQRLRHFVEKELGDPSRTMLSVAMEQFLEEQLASSVKHSMTWRLIGNQIPMARTHVPRVDDLTLPKSLAADDSVVEHLNYFTALGKLDLPIYLDTWDGYPVAREKFYQLCKKVNAEDLIVLTGDSHAFWANQLFAGNGDAMGIELGTAGITSPGDFESLGKPLATELDQRVAAHNLEILWTDCQNRGYVKLSLGTDKAIARFIGVSNVKSEMYSATTVKSYTITKEALSLSIRELINEE